MIPVRSYILLLSILSIYFLSMSQKRDTLQAVKLLDEVNIYRDQNAYWREVERESHKTLKTDYNYVIRDMYRSEGVLLMKLIHRETGLTAAEIIKKYRGKFSSSLYKNLGKIWDQDLGVKYDPTGVDKLTERIVLEIENELLEFDRTAKMVDKEEFKENMKEYRKDVKQSRKNAKLRKKTNKAKEKSTK